VRHPTLRHARALAVAVSAILVVACASTAKVINSWSAPGVVQVSFDGRKVLALMIDSDPWVRREAENELVQQMKRVQGVAAHTMFSEDELKDADHTKRKIIGDGFEGVVTMRLVGSEQVRSWQPGLYPSSYYSPWGYYGYARSLAYDPGYLRTDTIVQVETNIYSVGDEKLIWSSLSESFNPKDARKLVDNVARGVAKAMRKQGFVR